MKFEQIKVDVKDAVKARLSLYIQESYPQMYGDRKRPVILICPGESDRGRLFRRRSFGGKPWMLLGQAVAFGFGVHEQKLL